MNELYNNFFEDHAVEEATSAPFPAGNTTVSNGDTTQYIYAIIAIYAIILVLVIFTIMLIVIQNLKKSSCFSSCRKTGKRYETVADDDMQNNAQPVDELSIVLDNPSTVSYRDHDVESEYDNISLDLGRRELPNEIVPDTPPEYENPPAYATPNFV